jgi:GT2 family glycosyltransferase
VWGRIIVPLPAAPTDWERNVAGLERAPFATANCLYRWGALSAVEGFDERFTMAWREDSDLHFKLLELDRRCVHQPKAVVVHPARPAPWGVSLRLQRMNLFNALLYKKHPILYRGLIQAQPPWRYYAMVGAILLAATAATSGSRWVAGSALIVWAALTVRFCLQRLANTSRRLSHVLEMAVTSALIPPLAVFWRMVGALKYRVVFL